MSKPVIFVLSNLGGDFCHCLQKALPDLTYKNIPCKNMQIATADLAELKSEKCKIIVADPPVIGHLMYDVPHLKWAQATFAGVDATMKKLDPRMELPSFTLTRFGGVFGVPMAEYVLGQIIARERQFYKMYEDQKIAKWDSTPFQVYRPLSVLSIAILGLGDIGREVARMCKTFGMTVKALVRNVPDVKNRLEYIDDYRDVSSDMSSVFGECDYICSVLPATQDTDNILGRHEVLKACKQKQTVLINVGRGNAISEEALIHALKEQWVGGAILDVFNKEPLPSDSELWRMDNVTISPHSATQSFDWQVAEVFKANYKKYENGEQLDYQVDWNRRY